MKLFWFSLVLMIGACGREEYRKAGPETPFEILMERGRVHAFMPAQPSESLRLSGYAAEIHELQQLADSPYASWIQFDVRLMPDVMKAELPEQFAWVAARYGALFGELQTAEWFPAKRFMRRDEKRLFLNYERKVQGLIVRDNVLQLVLVQVAEDVWRLREIQGNVTGPAPAGPSSHDVNAEAGLAWLEDLTGRSDITVERMDYEWIPFHEEGHFLWRKAVAFEWSMDALHYQATLLPEEGFWLDAWPLAVHAKPIMTRALKRSYAEGGPREYPLSFSAVNSPSGNYVLGAEAFFPTGTSPSSVGLTGPRAMIFDNQSTDTLTLAGIQEQPEGFFVPEDVSKLAAVNAFVAVQRINRFARQFLTEEEAPFLNQALVVNVNLVEQSCNAFYSPRQQKMLLYKEGQGCANMALLNDVIYHEWGHALDDHVGRSPGIRDAAFSEGLADVVAAFYNGDSAIAPYFNFDNPEPIRDLINTRVHPQDKGSMHYEGGIISSTFWELREALIGRHGPMRGAHLAGRLFFRHLLAVDSYLESYAAVLRVDDDDDNPATRGPNHCLINKVFARHGLATGESCEDPAVIPQPVATGLNIALLDAGPEENVVHVLASAPAAANMALCLGPRTRCETDKASWMPLQNVGRHPDRVFFMSLSPIQLPSLSLVTLLRLQDNGELQDSRELKFFAK